MRIPWRAATAYREDRLCDQLPHPGLDVRGGVRPEWVVPAITAIRAEACTQLVLAAAYTNVARADFDGKPTFGYREVAFDHVQVLEGGSRDGMWIPRSVADTSDPIEQWWCTERQQVIPNTIVRNDVTSAVVWMPSQAAFDALPPEVTGQELAMSVRFPTWRHNVVLPLTLISLLIGLAAIGTIAVGTSISNAQKTALDEKSGMDAGANSILQIGTELVTGKRELPAELRGSTTIVGISSPYERTALIVDPTTFTNGCLGSRGRRNGRLAREYRARD